MRQDMGMPWEVPVGHCMVWMETRESGLKSEPHDPGETTSALDLELCRLQNQVHEKL